MNQQNESQPTNFYNSLTKCTTFLQQQSDFENPIICPLKAFQIFKAPKSNPISLNFWKSKCGFQELECFCRMIFVVLYDMNLSETDRQHEHPNLMQNKVSQILQSYEIYQNQSYKSIITQKYLKIKSKTLKNLYIWKQSAKKS